MDRIRAKTELAAAARKGIEEYLRSTSGANLMGANAKITLIDPRTLEIATSGGRPSIFIVHIKEGISRGKG